MQLPIELVKQDLKPPVLFQASLRRSSLVCHNPSIPIHISRLRSQLQWSGKLALLSDQQSYEHADIEAATLRAISLGQHSPPHQLLVPPGVLIPLAPSRDRALDLDRVCLSPSSQLDAAHHTQSQSDTGCKLMDYPHHSFSRENHLTNCASLSSATGSYHVNPLRQSARVFALHGLTSRPSSSALRRPADIRPSPMQPPAVFPPESDRKCPCSPNTGMSLRRRRRSVSRRSENGMLGCLRIEWTRTLHDASLSLACLRLVHCHGRSDATT